MKTLQDLFQLAAQAAQDDQKRQAFRELHGDEIKSMRGRWFIDFAGHVNGLSIRFYRLGWSTDGSFEGCDVYLSEDGIQEAYYFIKNRLTQA
jgi:hypothetical protein